jgi:hypothetical protein
MFGRFTCGLKPAAQNRIIDEPKSSDATRAAETSAAQIGLLFLRVLRVPGGSISRLSGATHSIAQKKKNGDPFGPRKNKR